MKLVVGLGNPGPRYARTRHNVGFRVVEGLAQGCQIPLDALRFSGRFGRGRCQGVELALLEPQTFMNRSGGAVAEALRELVLDDPSVDLLVVFDDVDLPFGRLRVRPAGGAGGHRGLSDVIERIGRRDFPRLRFGVGRPPPGVPTEEWVLREFTDAEERVLAERVPEAAQAALAIFTQGIEAVMNRANRELSEGDAQSAPEPLKSDDHRSEPH